MKLAVSRFRTNQKMTDSKPGTKLWVFSDDVGVKSVHVNSKSFWQIDGRRIYHRLLKTKFSHKAFCWEHLYATSHCTLADICESYHYAFILLFQQMPRKEHKSLQEIRDARICIRSTTPSPSPGPHRPGLHLLFLYTPHAVIQCPAGEVNQMCSAQCASIPSIYKLKMA